MRLSSGVEWSLHCCVSLGQARLPTSANRLAELHGVTATYLAKHLQALSRAGIVTAAQGAAGGYTLSRPTRSISVLDVVAAVDGDAPMFQCTEIRQRGPLAAPPQRCSAPCAIALVMDQAEQAWRAVLTDVTVADLSTAIDTDSGDAISDDLRRWLQAT